MKQKLHKDIGIGEGILELAKRQLKELCTTKGKPLPLKKDLIVIRNLISRAYFSAFWVARGGLIHRGNKDLELERKRVHSTLRRDVCTRFGKPVASGIETLFERRVQADYIRKNPNRAEAELAIEEAKHIICKIREKL